MMRRRQDVYDDLGAARRCAHLTLLTLVLGGVALAAGLGLPTGPRGSVADECIPPTPFVERTASAHDREATARVTDIFVGRVIERKGGSGFGTPVHGAWEGLEFDNATLTVEVLDRIKGTAAGTVRVYQQPEYMECNPIPIDPPLRPGDVGLFLADFVLGHKWYSLEAIDTYFLIDDDRERAALVARFSEALGTPVAGPAPALAATSD